MAVIKIERTVELSGPILTEGLNGTLFTTEGQAHQFTIHCTQGGTAVTLTGTVSAKFMREESNSTILIAGSLSNGAAVVTLPADCYHRSGRFSLTIFVTASSVTTCIYSATGSVKAAQAGTLVDEGTEVPDLDTILAMINGKVSKSGDTMSGGLTAPALTISKSSYPMMYFSNESSQLGLMMINHNSHNISFREMKSGTHFDAFTLPTANLSQTTDDYYDILTSKSAVTVAQGGTGKTSYSDMMQSFGLCSSNANATSFTFSGLDSISASRYKYGLVMGGDTTTAFVCLMFINTGNTTVAFYPLYQATSAPTLSGSVSGTTLTITGSSTVYGGLRLIWLNY